MKLLLLLIIGLSTFACSDAQTKTGNTKAEVDSIVKIEIYLSAFGVESDDFPSIKGIIDFTHDSSRFVKSYYNPAYKGATYSITKAEMQSILKLLKISDLAKLNPKYSVGKTDQPRSTITIFTTKTKYSFDDYGLEASPPLKDLYKIVYKF